MKMMFLFLSFFLTVTAEAAVKRQFMDFKMATQAMLERQDFGTPVVAGAGTLGTGLAGPTSAAALVVTSGFTQPDVPRNISMTPTGTTGDVESCVITLTGTNIKGQVITDTLTFSADASTIQSGTKAFKTLTSISFPANCESGGFAATWSVGVGEKIGLKQCMAIAGDWAWSSVGGTYESTRATVVVDADEVEKNTADFNGTMNGTNRFIGYFVQNFGCL